MVRNPTKSDLKRCFQKTKDGHKQPVKICNECGAIFEQEYNEYGDLINDEWANLEVWVGIQ